MKFVVELGYKKFVFDDAQNAIDFATIAKLHHHDNDDRTFEVTITIIDDKEEK